MDSLLAFIARDTLRCMRAFERAIFGDRARPWVALGLLLVLGVLGKQTADYAVEREGSARRCFADPSICGGEEVALSVWRVLDTRPGGFRVTRLGHVLQVDGPAEGLTAGGRISVKGRFNPEGSRLLELKRVTHPLWGVKRNFSLIGAIWVFCWLLASIRWGSGGLVCRG